MSVIDTVVGQRIKARRQALELTQTQLAEKIGVTFQQVQKYENGTNRVSAARLWNIAEVFEVPITFFFDSLDETLAEDGKGDVFADRGAMELIDLYTRLTDAQKQAVLSFLRSVAESDSPAAA
ncbi:helix-turn-helix transcriptional regulator [Mesobacterium sp. TK19101]|uniref:Helix-turn-helix transcriptional regulator n=1 Tax=Mesobacterium hydrothermale TaxID=3111907 RepID=A0ABU6HE48_9RHOB|nr:helix-turn-helix transcriptional regulator [Mesobacterium sp. TK19101]MEC3860271.1 helix-turn-helix transcriptional regulator [Mesobacterium sp. TK19101]